MTNKKFTREFFVIISFLLLFFYLSSCTNEVIKYEPEKLSLASCEGCHTNYAHLQKVYSPDTAEVGGSCGGEAPVYEPYDRVFMGGEGYADFKKSGHYEMGCTACHNGNNSTDDKNVAHGGDFISHPSSKAEEKCAGCHQEIVTNFANSIHTGVGQMRKVAIRNGLSGSEEFDLLPQHQIEGYDLNCAKCHGNCGNCHISRPLAGGGGLANGHKFTKTPDMVSVCVTCHTSRGGHAYLGVGSGTSPDVHFTKNNFTCLNCHSGAELHGNGQPVEQRYAYTELPTCEKCHTSIKTKNIYHTTHYDDLNCQVCHSQDYNNCGSCHVHGDGARIPAYMDYKIGVNPLPELIVGYKFTLVRRTLAAPDTWEKYGVPVSSNFDAFPTYNYTSPHNILRWTQRTTVTSGMSCSSSCHLRKENGVYINKDNFLFEENLLDWEKNASKKVTVDGKLPNNWMN